ncbi:MAG: TrwC relaxase [Firmicutes bacterium]|nr:TrwC relaxase [Bacillota bacterium]
MLSISNVTARMAGNYYIKDDYYIRDQSQYDHWQGKLCKRVALKEGDPIEAKKFQELLGNNPKRAGFDLTFSAPKSVSVAAAASDNVRQDMIAAHNAAVEKVLRQIEENEIVARVTHNGVTGTVKTGNMVCARFRHYVSRRSDPQLHDHCVVMNQTYYNKKIYAITNDYIYQNKIIYGQLYRNELAVNLQAKGYSVELTDSERGFFELSGMDKEILETFSNRRQEILEKLKTWNATDARSASKATLVTRHAKEHRDLGELQKSWRETILEIGDVKIEKSVKSLELNSADKINAFEQAVERLSDKQFAFTEWDLERAVLAEGCISGVNREDFRQILEKSDIVRLGSIQKGGGMVYYTTIANQAVESQIERITLEFRNKMSHIPVKQARTDLAVLQKKGLNLSAEQTEAVLHITAHQDQFIGVQGLAGTGKTYMLNAAKEVWESNGFRVTGAAYTGKAAEGLQSDAGIKSSTIHSMLNRLEKEAGNSNLDEDLNTKTAWNFDNLKPGKFREVWIVDEAGMINNNLFLTLQQAAIAKKAQVVFVGDYQQLAPIGTGNAFSNLVQSGKLSTCYLTDIIRQRENQQLLQAVREAVKGDIHRSLELVADSTREIASNAKRFRAITEEYTSLSAGDQANTIILTAKNKDRITLNESIRTKLVQSGKLEQGTNIVIQTGKLPEVVRDFSRGDKVIFFKNDYKLNVKNGQTGIIAAVEGQKITVETSGQKVVINADKYNHFDHGYAITTQKAQGVTENRVIVNLDSSQMVLNSRNSYYVDISRARHRVSIYVDDQKKINKQISQFIKKVSSHDFKQEQDIFERQHHPGFKLPTSTVNLLTQAIETRSSKIIDMAEEAIKEIQLNFKNKLGMHR